MVVGLYLTKTWTLVVRPTWWLFWGGAVHCFCPGRRKPYYATEL